MNKEELLVQLNQWKQEKEFEKIVQAIRDVPAQEWDLHLVCLLALAYNELGSFRQSRQVLEDHEKEYGDNALWKFHYGYALFNLNMFEKAGELFKELKEMTPEDDSVKQLLQACEDCQKKEYWKKEYGDGRELNEEKTLQYILNYCLHGSFETEDILEDDHIVLPEWHISIYPEIAQLKKEMVIITFNLESDEWGRDLVEHYPAAGKTVQQAVSMACSGFLLSMMSGIAAMKLKRKPLELTTSFAGNEHKWQVYLSNVLALGQPPRPETPDFYWNMLKDDIAKRIGNQRMCNVKIHVARSHSKISAECRINDIPVPELGEKLALYAKDWKENQSGSHKQYFFLKQELSTLQFYPFETEQIEEFTQAAMRMFHQVKTQEDWKRLPYQIEKMTGDISLATELYLFLPQMCAENGFNKMKFPDTIEFFFGDKPTDRHEVVYTSQLASYDTIRQCLFWNLRNQIFGNETDRLYQELVSVSAPFRTLQQAKEQGKPYPDGTLFRTGFRVDDTYKIR